MDPELDPTTSRKRSATASASSTQKKNRAKMAKIKRSDDLFDDPSEILGQTTSPLYNSEVVGIQNILKHPDALAVLPPSDVASLSTKLTADNLSRVVAEFRGDGTSSRHDPQWLASALQASRRRTAGEFDEYLNQRFEEDWGEENEYSSGDEDDEDDDNTNNDSGPTNGDKPPRAHKDDGDDEFGDDAGASASTPRTNANTKTDQGHEPGASHTESDGESKRTSGTERNGSDMEQLSVSVDELLRGLENVTAPPRQHVCLQRSVVKLIDIVNVGPVINGICPGDIIRYNNKDAVVESAGGKFRIWVPRGTHPHSEPDLRADATYPNNIVPKRIAGVGDVTAAMHNENPAIPLSNNWRLFQLIRQGNDIGNLFDFRQAWQFALHEYQYQQQLLFKPNRRRRLNNTHLNEGFQLIDMVALYRKIREGDLVQLHEDLIIDLGPELNRSLAEIAEPGYQIIMMDLRIMNSDGIPSPGGCTLEDAYRNGPNAFPTTYLRNLAGSYGYSNGHAHVGPLGLGKGFNNKHWGYARSLQCLSGSAYWGPVAQRKRKPNEFFNIHNRNQVGIDLDARGCLWTPEERAAVTILQRAKIQGKIAHYPIPVTMNRRCPELSPIQLSIQPDGRYAAADGSVLAIDTTDGGQSTIFTPPRHAASPGPSIPQSLDFDLEDMDMELSSIYGAEDAEDAEDYEFEAPELTMLAPGSFYCHQTPPMPCGLGSPTPLGYPSTFSIPQSLGCGPGGIDRESPSAHPSGGHMSSARHYAQTYPDPLPSNPYPYRTLPVDLHTESHDPLGYTNCPTLTSTDTPAAASSAEPDLSMIDPYLLNPALNSFGTSMSTPSLDYAKEPAYTNSLSSGDMFTTPRIHGNSHESDQLPIPADQLLDGNIFTHNLEHDTFGTGSLFGNGGHDNELLLTGTPKPANSPPFLPKYSRYGYGLKRKMDDC
ncbi:uncharacterized protein BP5553_07181 [Venustampulla echinocandica]|uniref:ASX DEUBAD domain-containing protein n=1 Tax=Venustampulla echinocandica TaxID=2656787 RepID=A0A370TIT5_9HELO|nr:uncharacterized protein BP5553_07181 [Venustampulla echinocandica]RDL35250.1 hypothetical protein BP5553_07181 [Venustampulla echinocandica]